MKLLFNLDVIAGNKVNARTGAGIGVVTAKEFLDAMQNAAARIYTGD